MRRMSLRTLFALSLLIMTAGFLFSDQVSGRPLQEICNCISECDDGEGDALPGIRPTPGEVCVCEECQPG